MGNIDSLTELANTLDIFFKGLSECNLLTMYSLQLQATAVDSPIQVKFQSLVHQFMKNLQSLLSNIPKYPGQELYFDAATQTDDGTQENMCGELLLAPESLVQPLANYTIDTKAWNEEISIQVDTERKHSADHINVMCELHSSENIDKHVFVANEMAISEEIQTASETIHFEDNLEKEDKPNVEMDPLEGIPCESLIQVASSSESDEANSEPAAIFICETCDKTFNTARSLAHHLSLKHGNKGQCDRCSQRFPSVQSLQDHCRAEHGGVGCFTCPTCGRRFMAKLSYRRHMDTHNGRKAAVCDVCGRMFSRADYLQKHYMTHTGLRPHSCHQCPRRFVSSGQLKVHELTHSGVREHVCGACGRAFSRLDKLKEHTLRHLNIKRFACDRCPRSYAEKRDLNNHLKVHNAEETLTTSRTGADSVPAEPVPAT